MLDRGESIRVARRLRAAINLDQGFIDIKACLRIADELENSGQNRSVKPNVVRERRRRPHYSARNFKEVDVTGADLVQILSLKSLGEGLLIEQFLANPGQAFTIDAIINILSTGEHNARNAIYDLRYHFKKLGFGPVISNQRGEGYYISERASREVIEFVESWRRCFILDVPKVT